MTEQGDHHLDYLHSSSLIKKTPASEGNSLTGTDSKTDQPKQEALLAPEGHPIMNVQSAQNYGLNFMSTMLGTQQVQFAGTEPQAPDTTRFPSFVVSFSILCVKIFIYIIFIKIISPSVLLLYFRLQVLILVFFFFYILLHS